MRIPIDADRRAGLSLVETAVATAVIILLCVSLGGVLLSTTNQRRQSAARSDVLIAAAGLIEEMRGADPLTIHATYDGTTRAVEGIDGANPDGTTLSVSVDATNPKILVVRVAASWTEGNEVGALDLQTRVFSPNG